MSKKAFIIIALIAIVLIQTSVFLIPASLLDGYFFVLKPMLWILLFWFAYFFGNKRDKVFRNKDIIFSISILGIVIYLFALFISGFFLQFSYNPMDSSLRGLLINFWTYIPIIVIMEYLRSQIMFSAHKKNKYIYLIIVTLIFTYASLNNLRSIVDLGLATQLDFLLSTLLPLLILNAL